MSAADEIRALLAVLDTFSESVKTETARVLVADFKGDAECVLREMLDEESE